MPFRYFEKSSTTATLQHWPARLVPPPRGRSGASCSRQTRTASTTSSSGRAVSRELAPVRLGNRGDVEQAGDPAATRDVGLETVDDRRHALEVRHEVAVLAGRDLDPVGRLVANNRQPLEIVRRHRLLEPP